MRLLPILAVSFTAAALCAHAADMQEGKWQISMHTETQGEKPTDMTMTNCMSKDQVMAQSGANNPYAEKDGTFEMSDGDCKTKAQTKGNVSTMETTCANGEVTKSTSTYGTDSFSMKSSMTSEGVTTLSTIDGKRIGGC